MSETDELEKADSKLEPFQQKVFDWRLDTFHRIGFTGVIAEALAGSTADLSVARKLHLSRVDLATILRILM